MTTLAGEIARSMREVVAVERNGKHDGIPSGSLNTIEQWADLIEQVEAEACAEGAAAERERIRAALSRVIHHAEYEGQAVTQHELRAVLDAETTDRGEA